MARSRPRIAWFTPLQPVESGISLYSEDILPILAKAVDIDVIVNGYRASQLRETPSLRVRQHRDFRPADYDLVIYQIGNSPVHLYMLPEIYRTPGVLVLHDTMLNHLFIQAAAKNGTLVDYAAEMERRYGPDGRRAADRVLTGQAPDDLFRFPMSEPLVESSLMTVVHSEYARKQALNWSPHSRVVRVPHGLRMPEMVDRSAAKAALGLPPDQFLIASISHINPHKRIDVVLRALKKLRRKVPARLILAGSVSPNFPLQRMINHLSLDQVVDTPGYVSDAEARIIAAAADVIVNLRYPTAGETSGSLLHSMAAGRTVLVSETGSFTELPGDAAIRIPVDALEEQMLIRTFEKLYCDQPLSQNIGRRARRFVETEHSLQRWADGYIDVIQGATGLHVERPNVDTSCEPVLEQMTSSEPDYESTVVRYVARDIAELGLGGDETLLEDVAQAQVELGLGVGMISSERAPRWFGSGGHDER